MKKKLALALTTTMLLLAGVFAPIGAQALTTSAPGCALTVTSSADRTATRTDCAWSQARTRYTTAAGTTAFAYGPTAKSSTTGSVPAWMKNQSAGRASALSGVWWVA